RKQPGDFGFVPELYDGRSRRRDVFQRVHQADELELAGDLFGRTGEQTLHSGDGLDDGPIMIVDFDAYQGPAPAHSAESAQERSVAAADVHEPAFLRQRDFSSQTLQQARRTRAGLSGGLVEDALFDSLAL